MSSLSLPVSRLSVCLGIALFASLILPGRAFAWTVTAPAGVELRAITNGGSGSAVAAGTLRQALRAQPYLAKYAQNGELLWEATGGENLLGELREAVTTDTGDVFVVGTRDIGDGRTTPLAALFNGADGNLVWQATVSPPTIGAVILEGSAEAAAVGPHGELMLGGYVRTENSTSAIVARLDPRNGNLLWNWVAPRATITDLQVDRRGAVLATGSFFLAVKLRGVDGLELWRVNAPSSAAQERGYPQMRALTLDARGNVAVGGALRDSLEDTRSFFVTRLAGNTGRRLSETLGPALYSFEAPARLVTCGSDLLAAGRLEGKPSVLRLRGAGGAVKWAQRPWELDDAPDRTLGVADLIGDSSGAYVLGTDFPGNLLVSGYAVTGKSRWTRDFGAGSGVGIALVGKQLFVIGTQPSEDGLRAVVIGLDARSGASKE